jgi:hypothetical protein
MRRSTARRLRLFRFVHRMNNAVFDTFAGTVDGLLLGAVSDRTLEEIDEQSYDRDGRYRDDAYNRRGLWHWEQEFVDSYLTGCRRVAVTGAGGGREVLALLRQGFDVVGYEPNANLVRVGNELLADEGLPACLRVAPRSGWPEEPDAAFDAVIVGWGSYTHIRGRQVRIAFLTEARRRMPDGGPLLASFWDRTVSARYYRTISRVGNVLRRLRRDRLLDQGDALGEMFVHFFDRDEIAREFAAAGFCLQSFETEGYARAVGTTKGREESRPSGDVPLAVRADTSGGRAP